MTASTRLKIARMLDEAGVDTIEAGFPISNEVSFASVKQIAKRTRNARVAALARCSQDDIEAAARAIAGARRPRIHVFIATSPVHLRHKLGISAERAVEMAADAVRLARTYCDDVEFSAEDATRSDPAFLAQIFSAAAAAGAAGGGSNTGLFLGSAIVLGGIFGGLAAAGEFGGGNNNHPRQPSTAGQ